MVQANHRSREEICTSCNESLIGDEIWHFDDKPYCAECCALAAGMRALAAVQQLAEARKVLKHCKKIAYSARRGGLQPLLDEIKGVLDAKD